MQTIKTLPGFEQWLEANLMEIETVQEMLSDKLSDNPALLCESLARAEAWNARISSLLADANAFLDLAERAALSDRNDDWTDLDRRVNLKATVVNERRMRDIIAGIGEALKNRLILGMSLRKQSAGERQEF